MSRRRNNRASVTAWVFILIALAVEVVALIVGASANTGEGFSGLAVVVLPIVAGVVAAPLALVALIISSVACFGRRGNLLRVRPWGAFVVSLLMVLYAASVLLAILPVLRAISVPS